METNQATAPESRGRSQDLLRDQLPGQAAQVAVEPELAAAWKHEISERKSQAAKIESLLAYKARKLEQNSGEHAFTRRAVEKAVTREAATALGLTEAAVRRLISTAEFLSEKLPQTWETYRAGRIDRESAAKAAAAVEDIAHREDLLAVIDAEVAERAPKENAAAVGKWVTRYVQELDTAGFQERYDKAQGKRYVKFRHLGNGMSHIEALIPTLVAAQGEQQIHAEARNAPRIAPPGGATTAAGGQGSTQDAAQGTTSGDQGANQGAAGLERTLPQRIADAFINRLGTSGPEQPQGVQSQVIHAQSGQIQGVRNQVGQIQSRQVQSGANVEGPGAASTNGQGLPGRSGVKIGILVPVQTLTGDSDAPAMSWDRAWSLPAGTARQIALDPDAEHDWYIAGTAAAKATETTATAKIVERAKTAETARPAETVASTGAETAGAGENTGTAATAGGAPAILTVVHPRKGPGSQSLKDWIHSADPVAGNLLTRAYQSRTAKDRQRDAILMRDGQCTQDGCTNPGWQAEIDHTQSYETGGSTTGTNLKIMCRDCHAIKSHRLGRKGESGPKSPPGPGVPARASPGEDDIPEWLVETRPPPDWVIGHAA